MRSIDLTGKVFGRWSVIHRAPSDSKGQSQWLCRCKCGTKRVMKSILIRRGISRSCGCLKIDLCKKRIKHGHAQGTISPTYWSWQGMKKRCNDPKQAAYGGRGIKVCARWRKSFANFLADMGERPEGKTLDRRNNDGNYTPNNCRWATGKQQGSNKRNNVPVTWKGQTKTIVEWARITGIPQGAIGYRLLHGWSAQDTLTMPVTAGRRLITIGGCTHSVTEWARIKSLAPATVHQRIYRGMSVKEALK